MNKKAYNPHEIFQKIINNPGDSITAEELAVLIDVQDEELRRRIFQEASRIRDQVYGRRVFFRGLIEFSNYCKNDCLYCGIRRSNRKAERYRLTEEQILECCETGYRLGFRTFVLQGGEDPFFTDEIICNLVSEIKRRYPECAITLSIGEKSRASYEKFKFAGVDRYLLRHETASDEHYRKLHPESMSLASRKKCLWDLKNIGFQVGAGFMVGSPYQTSLDLAQDLLFLKELQPHMVGIGPFIPHKDTPFASFEAGTLEKSIIMVALTRILLPHALLPATTALGTINPKGREQGLMAGANVVMPNLSPKSVRNAYSLYNDKICTGEEAAECMMCIQGRIRSTALEPDLSRGDHIS